MAQQEPFPKLASTPLSSSASTEYYSALSVLNDATMSRACALLLSDTDYDHDTSDQIERCSTVKKKSLSEKKEGNEVMSTDKSRLLSLFHECHAAATVVTRIENTTFNSRNSSKMTALTRSPSASSRLISTPGSKGTPKAMIVRKGSGLRGGCGIMRGGKSRPAATFPTPPLRGIQRSPSDVSRGSEGKRLKASPVSSKYLSGKPQEAKAPPPSALHFLTALNSQNPSTSQSAPSKATSSCASMKSSNVTLSPKKRKRGIDTPPSPIVTSVYKNEKPTSSICLKVKPTGDKSLVPRVSILPDYKRMTRMGRNRTNNIPDSELSPSSLEFEIGEDVFFAKDDEKCCPGIVKNVINPEETPEISRKTADVSYVVELNDGEIKYGVKPNDLYKSLVSYESRRPSKNVRKHPPAA